MNLAQRYNLSYRGNLRGKARAGWIRPTISQFFTSKDFTDIIKIPRYDSFDVHLPYLLLGQTVPASKSQEAIIENGKLVCSVDIGQHSSSVILPKEGFVYGDFDFYISYDATEVDHSLSGINMPISDIRVNTYDSNEDYEFTYQVSYTSGTESVYSTWSNDEPTSFSYWGSTLQTSKIGRLRLKREGTTITAYADNGSSGWVVIRSSNGCSTNKVIIRISHYTNDPLFMSHNNTTYFDDFYFNSKN